MSNRKGKFPLLTSLGGHSGDVLSIAFHPSAPILATGGYDNSIILWDTDSYQQVARLLGHATGVICLAFHPTAPLLVSGCYGGKMMLWDTTTHQCLSTIQAYDRSYTVSSSIAFRPRLDGTESFDMVTTASDQLVKLWKLSPDNKELTLVQDIRDSFSSGYDAKCIVFHPTKPLVATAEGGGGTLFDIVPSRWGRKETISESLRFTQGNRHRKHALSVAFHPHAPIVATCSKDRTIKLWKIFDATGREGRYTECVKTLNAHEGDVTCVAFHPTAPVILSCSLDRTIKLWRMTPDQRSAFCIETLTAPNQLTCLAIHPSGRFFATGCCRDGTAKLWDCSILNIESQVQMAKIHGLERHLIGKLIPLGSMYDMRDPGYLNRIVGRRTSNVRLLQKPSAESASAKENASRLALLWAETRAASSPRAASPKKTTSSPRAASPKKTTSSPRAASPKKTTSSPRAASPKKTTSSPKSPKSGKGKEGLGGGGSVTCRHKKNSPRKVKRCASKTKRYPKLR
jgi:hypothetical protein